MRCFVALRLPREVRELIAKNAEQMLGDLQAFRLIAPDNLHLTLHFLGELEESQVGRVIQALSEELSGFQSFDFVTTGFGAFPNPRRPNVVWAGTEDGAAELKQLAAVVHKALAPLGMRPDKPFSAHITVARVRRGKHAAMPTKWPDFLADVPVREVCLMRSDLHPGGAVYSVIEAWKLRR